MEYTALVEKLAGIVKNLTENVSPGWILSKG